MLESINTLNTDIKLIFPDRGKFDKEPEDIEKFYEIKQSFEILKLPHKLPFNSIHIKVLEKLNFLISSFVWSFKTIKKYSKSLSDKEIIMTRTHWILYFASSYQNKIIYECHKFSKIDNLVFKKLAENNNVVIVFPNNELRQEFRLSKLLLNNSLILESAFDEKMFSKTDIKKIKNKVLFVGNLLRFNKSRNLEFLIKAFHDKRLSNFELIIVGGPNDIIYKIKDSLSSNTLMVGRYSQKKAINEIMTSEIGLLINEGSDRHSVNHTSPIKYFEYLRGGLKVLAVDFPSHRNLPMGQNNFYFEENDTEDFIEKLLIASKSKFIYDSNLKEYSYISRTKKLLNHIARLEGLEPPTF